MKKKNKLYVTLKIIKRRVKLRTLLLLALTLTANSYAWFIYTTKVNNVIEARVRSWNVRFDLEQSELAEYIDFVVSDMYPGMPDFEREIRIVNSGETTGKINYEIISARVINTEFIVDETTTSEMMINKLKNEYPFKIDIGVSNDIINPEGGEESFLLKVTWAYESGNDTEDTYWGNQAYDYQEAHPNDPIITIRIKISVIQA